MTRLCTPQRHRCWSSAAATSARLGRGFVCKQRGRRDHDAGQAIAALAGLLVEDGLLDRVQRAVARQAFDRGDRLAGQGLDLARAGIGGLAVDQHHAGAALLGAAAEPGAAQAEIVAQHRQQRPVGSTSDADGCAVDDERVDGSGIRIAHGVRVTCRAGRDRPPIP